ncbi:MAG: hypothetical protein ACOC1L_05265 [Bacillota bacterium]
METLVLILIIVILTFISIGVSFSLSKAHRNYVFVVPTVYTVLSIIAYFIASSFNGIAGLGYIIIGILLVISAIISWIASIALYIAKKQL